METHKFRALDFFQDWWARMTHGAKYGGSVSEMMGPRMELNKINANIQTCIEMGTRLVSIEVIQRRNNDMLENLSKLHQTM